jgi:hypothetical protein
MGNFFPMMVCGLFCVFWLSFGLLQLPSAGIAASYSAAGNASEGALSVGYNAGIALYLMALGFTMFTFFIFTLKTNTVFALIFAFTTSGVFVMSSAYWHLTVENYAMATSLQHVYAPCATTAYSFSADRTLGIRGSILHCGPFRLVHDFCYDGCWNAPLDQATSWRFVSFLATNWHWPGRHGKARVMEIDEECRELKQTIAIRATCERAHN